MISDEHGGGAMTFDEWWDNWGSGIVPSRGEDREEHARRVARASWAAGLRTNLRFEQQAADGARQRYEAMLRALVEATALLKPLPIYVDRELAERSGIIPGAEPVPLQTPSSRSTGGSEGPCDR